MAAGDIAPVPGLDLTTLLNTFLGKSGSTTGSTSSTSTTSSNISDAGVQEMLKEILEGNGGIKTIANAEKSAGLYNSSSGTLLTNDLLTSAAAKVAVAKAGTTTTTSGNTAGTTKQDPQLNPLKAGIGLAGVSLLDNILKGSGSGGIADLFKSGASGIGSLLTGAMGGAGYIQGSSDTTGGNVQGIGGAYTGAGAQGPGTDDDAGGLNPDIATPNQLDAASAANSTLPNVDDWTNGFGASTTQIPITALFPETGGGTGTYNDYGGGSDSSSSDSSDEDDSGPDLP